jgi:hypothetical protein
MELSGQATVVVLAYPIHLVKVQIKGSGAQVFGNYEAVD